MVEIGKLEGDYALVMFCKMGFYMVNFIKFFPDTRSPFVGKENIQDITD